MLQVVEYHTLFEKRSRNGQPKLNAGRRLYLIKGPLGYYVWAYTYKDTAEDIAVKLMKRIKEDRFPKEEQAFNFYADPERCLHTNMKKGSSHAFKVKPRPKGEYA